MLECPKCNGNCDIKSGKIKGRQRHKCKPCSYFYTVKQKSIHLLQPFADLPLPCILRVWNFALLIDY